MKSFLISFALILSQSLFSQIPKNYIYYDGYDDYINNNPMQPEVVTYVKEFTPNAILIDSFKYKESNKTAKKERLSWASFDGKDFFFKYV